MSPPDRRIVGGDGQAHNECCSLTGFARCPNGATMLLSASSSGYLSSKFGKYLRLVGIRHIAASPYHPQTNGKVERYHRTVNGDINLLPYDTPGDLEAAISSFVEYYNYRRYHAALGDVAPFDVYSGGHLGILLRRKEAKRRTLRPEKELQ